VVHKRFNKIMQKLSGKLCKGTPTASLKKARREATASFVVPNIHICIWVCDDSLLLSSQVKS